MKKYGKKLIACILSFAMALSLAACGSGDSAPASGGQSGGSAAQTTIQWWTPNWDEAVSREFVEEFEAENPDIHIELVITDWDTYKDKITTAISTSGAPEIVTVLLTDVAPFANKGLLELSELAFFDENGDLKNYPRQYNTMNGGFDKNNPLALDISLYAPGFVAYVNGCAGELERRGAKLMYSFPPMNASAFSGERDERSFQLAVADLFDCPVISDVADYIMEEGWFYDSNFHLNSAGMTVRTVQLVNDIKNELGNTSKTEIDLPNMPVAPDEDVEGEGDNSCKDCFTYELVDGYYTVTGLTEEGAGRSELVLPYQVNGIYINNFTAEVFAGTTAVQSIYIQGNISVLPDGAFSGCSSLSAVYLAHGDPADISVGYSLFEGAPRMRVYVPEDALGAFTNNYFWGRYADRLGAY